MDKAALNCMRWSSCLFVEQVWPIIKPSLDGGDLIPMEGRPDIELMKKLDMSAGIDGWQVHAQGMRGIASRVQQGERAYNTFTVRMARKSGTETEYAKRFRAIHNPQRGWIFPTLTIQAYSQTQKGPILSVGITRTVDLIDFITQQKHYVKSVADAVFAVCPWHKMIRAGYRVKIIAPTLQTP
jgi:hypothetical protein